MASLLKCGISLFLIEAHWHQLVYLPPSYGWGNRVMEAARARAKSRAVMPLRQRRAEVSKAVLDKLTCLLAAAQRCWRTVSASASLSSAGAGTSAQQHIGGGMPSQCHICPCRWALCPGTSSHRRFAWAPADVSSRVVTAHFPFQFAVSSCALSSFAVNQFIKKGHQTCSGWTVNCLLRSLHGKKPLNIPRCLPVLRQSPKCLLGCLFHWLPRFLSPNRHPWATLKQFTLHRCFVPGFACHELYQRPENDF